MRIFLGSIGGLLFLGAVIAQVMIRVKMRPPASDHEEEVYWEFEDQDPDVQRYELWLKRSYTLGAAGVLFLFAALMI